MRRKMDKGRNGREIGGWEVEERCGVGNGREKGRKEIVPSPP